MKFVGVIVDDELSWAPKTNYVREKLTSTLSIIVIIKLTEKCIPVTEYLMPV